MKHSISINKIAYLYKRLVFILVFFANFICSFSTQAQCNTTVSSFPYFEDFEASNGNWSSPASGLGISAPTWVYGTPLATKPLINVAGSGTKCWYQSAPGARQNFYGISEKSYLASPCFDFTNVQTPHISFKIAWEIERTWEGVCLQYTTNPTAATPTWVTVGIFNDPTNCYTQNWYNIANVTNLGPLVTTGTKPGWSGRKGATTPGSPACQGGSGSALINGATSTNPWVTAKHCISNLAGQPAVKFRFVFGAGATCNDYDGAAIDDVLIQDVSITADFNYTCINSNSVDFLNNSSSTACTYQWNFGDAASGASNTSTLQNPNHTFSAPGVYTVSLTSRNPCNAQGIMTKTISILDGTIQKTDVTCNSLLNGSATITGSFGNNYIYNWDNNGNTQTINNLTVGVYSVTLNATDACPITRTVSIVEPPAITYTTSSTNDLCNQSIGLASIAVSGGNVGVGYIYSWQPGLGNTNTLNNISAGAYSVTVTDANGCSISDIINVTNIGGPQAAIVSTSSVSCFGGNDGSITSTGGSGNYNYLWNTNQVSSTINGLGSGIYNVTITDNNNCSSVASATVDAPTAAVSATLTPIDASCGLNNGSISIQAQGGTNGYTYNWTPNVSNNNTANNLAPGNYTITVSDQNGCSIDLTSTLNTSPSLTINGINTTSVSCFGNNTGAASVSNVNCSYLWSTGSTNQQVNNLASGIYSITITDANGCSDQSSVTINEPSAALTTTISATNTNCGQSNGSASVIAQGGTPIYSYNWNNNLNTPTINNVLAGTYNVTITDANGCSATDAITISNASGPVASIVASNSISCFGGNNGSATATGGNGNFNYLWSNGQTNAHATSLTSGFYNVIVSDNTGCSSTKSVFIDEPIFALSASTSVVDAICNGSNGSISVTPFGGTPNYTYSWTPNVGNNSNSNNLAAGSYSVVVSDANGCTFQISDNVLNTPAAVANANVTTSVSCFGASTGSASVSAINAVSYLWSNGATSTLISNIPAGPYSVTVTDINGCSSSSSVMINQPLAPITTIISTTNANCGQNDGSASITAQGGTSGYSYTWSNNINFSNNNNIPAGAYSVTITDAKGCKAFDIANVSNSSGPVASIVASSSVSCFGGNNGSATATGGNGNFNYLWNNNSTSNQINNLAAGIYTVSVSDNNGCISISQANITEPTSAISVSLTTSNASCGLADGSVTSMASGGTFANGYTYQWSNGATTASINNIAVGSYSLTVSDHNGCTTSTFTNIINGNGPVITASTSAVLCFGGNDGSASISATGGTSPYMFAWDNGSTDAVISNMPSGVYSVTVTDVGGCSASSSATISQPAPITITPISPVALCTGSSANISANVNGISGCTFTWIPGSINGANITVAPNINTTYTVVAKDPNGCTSLPQTVDVSLLQLPVVSFTSDVNEGCAPLCVNFTNNTPNAVAAFWQFGDDYTSNATNSLNHCFNTSGNYGAALTVTDMNGCSNTLLINNLIDVHPNPIPLFSMSNSELSILEPNLHLSDLTQGSVSQWLWDFGDGSSNFSSDQNPSYNYTDTGSYVVTLTVINSYGCSASISDSVFVNTDHVVYIPNAFTPNNDGKNDIFIPQILGVDESSFHLAIYNRWGELIFTTKNPYAGWDGKINGNNAPIGTYVYRIEYRDIIKNKNRVLTGSVSCLK